MTVPTDDTYESPNVTEYGKVESITNEKDKCGTGSDNFQEGNDLTGSVVDTGNCDGVK